MTDTDTVDLEVCVNKNYAQIELPECSECEGFNYNCTSYYPLGRYKVILGDKYIVKKADGKDK